MGLEARVTSLELALAAKRAQECAPSVPQRTVRLQIVYYDSLGVEPDMMGERYEYVLPLVAPVKLRHGGGVSAPLTL